MHSPHHHLPVAAVPSWQGAVMSAGAFPRRFARSGRFRLGEPGEFAVSPDGRRVAFLRSESGTDPRGAGPLPVLLDPYGGPGSQRVLAARLWWFGVSQWFAEQGFAVVVTDGRGTPGRGPVWGAGGSGAPGAAVGPG